MPKSLLLDQVREVLRLRHYSIRTEEAYVQTIRRFILYHRKRHPREMGVDEIRQYLSHLATDGNVAASTQNVALCALLFLYRQVLQIDLPLMAVCLPLKQAFERSANGCDKTASFVRGQTSAGRSAGDPAGAHH
jgi:site-specific recombinase XerD